MDVHTLEQAKQQWQSAADMMPQLICLLNGKGHLIRTNRTVERWGLGRVDDVKGLHLHAILHGDCADPECYFKSLWLSAVARLSCGERSECEVFDPVLRRHLSILVQPLVRPRHPLREAAAALTGAIAQVPPMVSALKVGGQRLYRLARRGETVERAPRPVRVHAWEWLAFDLPEASFRVVVSGGTYVRTLAHDLGERLGPGGALRSLRRLRSEPFGLEGAVTMRDLDTLTPAAALARAGVPLAEALRVLPAVTLDAAAAADLGHGRRPAVEPGGAPVGAGPRSVAFFGPGGTALALGGLEPAPDGRALACPRVVFPWAVRQGRP